MSFFRQLHAGLTGGGGAMPVDYRPHSRETIRLVASVCVCVCVCVSICLFVGTLLFEPFDLDFCMRGDLDLG